VIKYLPLVWRNLGRNPTRSALTGSAIAMAIALVCVLRTMPAGLDDFLSSLARNTRISVHNEAGIVYPLPASYLQKVRAVPGVIQATSWTWFGGAIDPDEGVTFPNFAVDAETIGEVYDDLGIDPQALEAFRRQRDALIVGRQTMTKYGWKVGDRITLKSTVFPVDLDMRIVGEIPEERDPRGWFQREYLEQALEAQGYDFDLIGVVWARVDDPARVNDVMRTIDEMFRNSEAETASETEKSFWEPVREPPGFVCDLIVTGW
jgi:putative ABC transport system permease protein